MCGDNRSPCKEHSISGNINTIFYNHNATDQNVELKGE